MTDERLAGGGHAEGHQSGAIEDRRRKLEALRQAGGVVFPTKWERREEIATLAERFNQTHVAERACVRMYETNQAGLDALPAWLDHCNTSRPHGSLDHRTPMSHLANNVSGSHI